MSRLPDPPWRDRQRVLGAILLAGSLILAVTTVTVTVHRQRERDRATAAAVRLCDQINELGRRCAVDPGHLPGAVEAAGQAPPVVAAPLRPLPPRYVSTTPIPAPRADEGVAAQPVVPAPEAAVVTVEVIEGRVVLTYVGGARVDAGPAAPAFGVAEATPAPSPDLSVPSSTPVETPGGDPT